MNFRIYENKPRTQIINQNNSKPSIHHPTSKPLIFLSHSNQPQAEFPLPTVQKTHVGLHQVHMPPTMALHRPSFKVLQGADWKIWWKLKNGPIERKIIFLNHHFWVQHVHFFRCVLDLLVGHLEKGETNEDDLGKNTYLYLKKKSITDFETVRAKNSFTHGRSISKMFVYLSFQFSSVCVIWGAIITGHRIRITFPLWNSERKTSVRNQNYK